MSYRRAIATLRRQNRKICFASEAIGLPSIGVRLAEKIEEIVRTDSLKRLQYAKLEPDDASLKLFLGIYGVGLKHAQKWVAAGYKTLQDILNSEKLSDSQRIGIERHADFATRIPRDEVQKHGDFVVGAANEIDNELRLEIMGSFRRVGLPNINSWVHVSSQSAKGARDCGDVDIMITKEGAQSPYLRAVLDQLVDRLTKAGFLKCACEPVLPFLIATLTAMYSGNTSRARRWIESKDHGHTITSRQLTNHNVTQWHGASQISPDLPWRRIGDSAHPV